MMDTRTLADLLNQSNQSNQSGHPPLETCGLETLIEAHATSLDQVHDHIRQFCEGQNTQGWLCCQSEVVCFNQNPPSSGVIQYGEIANDAHQSLVIRRHPNQGWRVAVFQERAEGKDLVETISHLGRTDRAISLFRQSTPYELRYRRYWRHHQNWGYLPHAARFIGFFKGDPS